MFNNDPFQLLHNRSDSVFRGTDQESPAGVLPDVLSEEIEPFGDRSDFRLMADIVETSFDVTLQYPLCAVVA